MSTCHIRMITCHMLKLFLIHVHTHIAHQTIIIVMFNYKLLEPGTSNINIDIQSINRSNITWCTHDVKPKAFRLQKVNRAVSWAEGWLHPKMAEDLTAHSEMLYKQWEPLKMYEYYILGGWTNTYYLLSSSLILTQRDLHKDTTQWSTILTAHV